MIRINDAISEITGTILLIVLVIALAGVMAALFSGVIDLTGKSAFIAPEFERGDVAGKTVITIHNKGGDTAYMKVTGQRNYEMGVYIVSPSGTVRAQPVASVDAFEPGRSLYLFQSSSGYQITGTGTDLSSPDVLPFTACPVRVQLVDENAHVLITQQDIECPGSPTQTPPAPAPVTANFMGNPASGDKPLAVLFTELSTGPVTSWSWEFGDGNSSAVRQPSHTYSTGGSYSVRLTVSNGTGSDTMTRTRYITVTSPAPVKAAFTLTPSQGDIPFTVRFTDTSSGPVVSWYWTFGDGGFSKERNPTHTYTVVGWKTVNLTVMNASGGSDTNTCTGSCLKATAVAPVTAAFSANLTSGDKPFAVQFTDASTGPVNWWLWEFGDGQTCNERNCPRSPVHTYTKTGMFTVSLTVRNSSGSDTMTRTNYITGK